MLVISRLKTEVVVIRDETGAEVCRVTVVETRGHKIRLGFDAPENIDINRLEIDQNKYPEHYKGKT